MSIPIGFSRCKVCGEFNGTTKAKDLDWEGFTNAPDPEDEVSVSCLCQGVECRLCAEVTHNHPEGIKGAQAVAAAVFMARTGFGKAEIREYIGTTFGYRLDLSLERIREDFQPDITCPGSVPQSITAFLVSESVEDTIRNAVSLGGDSDTVACIAGGLAEAFYGGVPGGSVASSTSCAPFSRTCASGTRPRWPIFSAGSTRRETRRMPVHVWPRPSSR